MHTFARLAIRWYPVVVLIAYGRLIADYVRHLDSSLKYVKPEMPSAPEDILGFGFWVMWSVFAIWFVSARSLSFRFEAQRKVGFWSALLFIFSVLSLVDFFLYNTLENQVLSG